MHQRALERRRRYGGSTGHYYLASRAEIVSKAVAAPWEINGTRHRSIFHLVCRCRSLQVVDISCRVFSRIIWRASRHRPDRHDLVLVASTQYTSGLSWPGSNYLGTDYFDHNPGTREAARVTSPQVLNLLQFGCLAWLLGVPPGRPMAGLLLNWPWVPSADHTLKHCSPACWPVLTA